MSRDNAYYILQECMRMKNHKDGSRLQFLMLQNGLVPVTVLLDHLIRLYGSCGCWFEANDEFKTVLHPSVYTWIAIISAHANHGQTHSTMDLYHSMQLSGLYSNKYIYLAVLKACIATAALSKAILIHAWVILVGLQYDIFLESTLIDTYAKCGSLEESCKVFNTMINPNVVAWGAVLDGFAQHDKGYLALDCFNLMQKEGIKPNSIVFLSVLKACSNIGSLETSRYVHERIIDLELHFFDVIVGNMLVDMYAKCGSLTEACKVFHSLVTKNIVTWNVIITAHAKQMDGLVALYYFDTMNQEAIVPNKVTFSTVLKACQSIGHIRRIHEQIIGSGLEIDVIIGNSLVDSYSRNENMEEAHRVFNKFSNKDVISWGTIIAGYSQHGEGLLALKCFENMEQEGIQSNEVTFSSILKACGNLASIEHGRYIHTKLICSEIEVDVVLGSTLVDMYGKCGKLEEAREVFDKFSNQDIVLWGTMISAYALHGEALPSLQCFDNMRKEGIEPDKVIFSSIVKACGSVGAIERGRHMHDQIIKRGFHLDLIVGSALLDMYAKCGNMVEADKVFNKLPIRDVIPWGAMIAGYAQLGNAASAVQCFEDMQNSGLRPNGIIYISILNACCHVGLVNEGRIYFRSMTEDHKIGPELYHFNCMIDLLSNAGCLNEAGVLLQNTPKMNIYGWTGMLNACRIYGNSDLARNCFEVIASLDTECAGGYVLMSNFYAKSDVAEVVITSHAMENI